MAIDPSFTTLIKARNHVAIPILDLTEQYRNLKDEIQSAIGSVLESGKFILGPEVTQFEQESAAYLGVKHAVGVNSGTDALVIGLRAAGIKPGDEVITTPFSFFATAESISNVGATPIFVGVEASGFNIDPNLIEAKITPKTKAIMPVHLYGCPAAMAKILDIAATHNLKIVEDCAQSFGARYSGQCEGCNTSCKDKVRTSIEGKCTGSIGDVGAFSFFPTKNLGAYGDGGLLVMDDDEIAESARKLRTHGSLKKYRNEILGYNSRLDSLQAAVLRVKLKYIDLWNQKRREVAESYNQALENVDGIIVPKAVKGHVFHQYTIQILEGKRDAVRAFLQERGISSMIYYPTPQDRLPIYAGQHPTMEVSDRLSEEVLSLPIYPEITQESIATVVAGIKEAVQSV